MTFYFDLPTVRIFMPVSWLLFMVGFLAAALWGGLAVMNTVLLVIHTWKGKDLGDSTFVA